MHDPHDKPKTFSAPAPDRPEDDDAPPLTEAETIEIAAQDELFEAYGHWCRTRNFFGPPPVAGSVLGRLQKRKRTSSGGPPDAACSAMLAALHIAVVAQPADGLDRKVFQLHYLYSVASVKQAAAALGVSRNHWYRLLRSFRARVVSTANSIMNENLAAADRLQSRGGSRHIADDED